MRLITMMIASMLCCTGLHAELGNAYKKYLRAMTNEKIASWASWRQEEGFESLEIFEKQLIDPYTINRDIGIEFYQKELIKFDTIGENPSEFYLRVYYTLKKMNVDNFDCEYPQSLQSAVHCVHTLFEDYEFCVEELRIRAGVKK